MKKKALMLLPMALIFMGAGCSQGAVVPPYVIKPVPPVNVPTPITPAPIPQDNLFPVPPTTTVPPTSVPPVNLPPKNDSVNSEAIKTFDISAVEYSYKPKSITVSAGDKVKINFKNNGNYPHNITIRELNVATKTIQSGESDSLTFTAPATPQTLNFYCSVDSHGTLGLTGTIIVK